MSDTIYKEQAEKLEKVVAELENKLADAQDKLSKADIEKYTAQIDELTGQVSAKDEEITSLKTKVDEVSAKIDEVTTALENEKSSKIDLEKQLNEIKLAEARANRISTLVDGGINKDIATDKVEKFANLSDDQFEVVATELIEAAKAKMHKAEGSTETEQNADEQEADEEQDSTEANADAETLENAEANQDVELNVDTNTNEESELLAIRKELQASIAARLGRKINNSDDGDDK